MGGGLPNRGDRSQRTQACHRIFLSPASDPLSKFLQIRQMYVDGNYQGFDWKQPPEPGTQVELSSG
jgi:hypothetical protein